ncbi:MAG: sugar transferase [Amphiplicatus sp.]
MSIDLGDWAVTTLVAGPVVVGLALIALAATLYAPELLGAVERINSENGRRARPIKGKRPPDIFGFDVGDGRVQPGAEAAPEFAAAFARRRVACASTGKRAFDIAAALALIVFFAPLFALVAALVRLDSPGPALYRQRRIGRNGAPFYIYKFRSMVVDAERGGACWAQKNDKRVTRIGCIIRKTRIDEMPQAFNVLKGEMSFVGPRPERPEFVELLEKEIPNYHLRHAVRPGITGWAQVKYVYGASVDDARIKLQYDLYYIRHFSLTRDLLIIMMTVRVALFGLGSR